MTTAALGTRPVGRLLWHNCWQNTVSFSVYGIYAAVPDGGVTGRGG